MKIKDVFYGVMLGILIPSKYIQGELQRKIKILLKHSIMMELNFLCKKKILSRLKQETFALMCLVMKIDWLFQFTFWKKN